MSDKKTLSLKRVVELAADAFSSRKFSEVSISDISAAAHCSTATIYSVFGSKESLFIEAILHISKDRMPPQLGMANSPSLINLLRFAETRVRALASSQRRGVMRAISAQPELAKLLIDRLPKPDCGYDPLALEAEITACVKAGLLRGVDQSSIAYHIIAVTAYEPVILWLLYNEDPAVDLAEILRKVFAPLVTVEGERLLESFIATELEPPFAADDQQNGVRAPKMAAVRG